jgi:hypothetical protein
MSERTASSDAIAGKEIAPHDFRANFAASVFGASVLLFAASAALTAVWCASMSDMSGMTMPGGWRMSIETGRRAALDCEGISRTRITPGAVHFVRNREDSSRHTHVPNCAWNAGIGNLGRCRPRNKGERGKVKMLFPGEVFAEGKAA